MATAAEIAENHQQNVIRRTEVASQRGLRAWRQMDLGDLDRSWLVQAPAIVATVSTAQYQNAVEATGYANAAGKAADATSTATRTVPQAFVGIDGSGRSLEGLLHGAVTTTKEALGAGLAGPVSFQAGATYLAAMIKTAIADLARNADMAAAGGHGWTRYVRVVEAGACSRCAILAGATGYRAGFKRHPACRCTAYPLAEGGKAPTGYTDAGEYFDSLSKDEQDRIFTKSGAEAIRSGASVDRVVGARRGATGISYGNRIVGRQARGRLEAQIIGTRPDGSPIRVYSTNEATTRRGFYGRQLNALGGGNRVRLMPETIMQIADGDAATARVLLRDAGYIDTDFTLSAADRLAMQTTDRAFADRIYRAAGYTL